MTQQLAACSQCGRPDEAASPHRFFKNISKTMSKIHFLLSLLRNHRRHQLAENDRVGEMEKDTKTTQGVGVEGEEMEGGREAKVASPIPLL